jgi:amino acid transporter
MALYPTLLLAYLGMLSPSLVAGHLTWLWGVALVLGCVGWNLLGAHDVGESSRWMCCLLLVPFVVLTVAGLLHAEQHPATVHWGRVPQGTLGAALLVAMWNTMGWDQASTVAREVEDPQRTYISAMLGAVALVTACYVVPVTASALAGVSAAQFATGAWVEAGRMLGGNALAVAITAGGALTAIGMFNALTMSYARLPFALAQERMLPPVFARVNARRVPWACVVALGVCWLLALGLGFTRLLVMDVVLYGASLLLEFVALAVLRAREPHLPRPFRVPGGLAVAALLGVPSAVLLGYAAWSSRAEMLGSHRAVTVCAVIALAGAIFGGLTVRRIPPCER